MTSHPPLYAGAPTVPGYVLGEVLGRGSSAVVWAGVHPSGDRVAVKVFAGERPPLRRDEVVRACERELTLSQRVHGHHVVRARECLELDDGRVALVLDVADAGSLRDVVTIRGALPLGEVVTTLTGVATGLADLEAAGVVHGDVAPANVLFDTDGRPVLADLSAARVVEDGRPVDVMGTSGFTAPEVLAGQPLTPACDVWSMGALLWYARTGGRTPPPWVGDLHWRLPGGPVDGPGLAAVTEAVGPELWPVVLRMLADDPDYRPTAAEAALAVYRSATAEPVGLVGRHPDPAAAVTRRLRSEAAETRSRAQLRAQERARERSVRRSQRGGVRTAVGRLRRWATRGPQPGGVAGGPPGGEPRGAVAAADEPAELLAARRGVAPVGWAPDVGAERSSVGGEAAGPPRRWLGTVGGRVALVGGVGAAAAAALLVLAALGGPPVTPVTTVTTVTPVATVVSASADGTAAGDASSSPASAAPVAGGVSTPDGTLSGPVIGPLNGPLAGSLDNPTAVLQAVADARAAALSAADPVALAAAEVQGSAAYAADAATVARLREQRQRYRDLTFTVSGAQVVSSEAGRAVVRATVGRSASTVEGEDGSLQSMGAVGGEPLRYVLTLTDGGWRLTDVTAA